MKEKVKSLRRNSKFSNQGLKQFYNLLFLFYFSNRKLNRSISLLRLIFSEQKRWKKRLKVDVEIVSFLIKA